MDLIYWQNIKYDLWNILRNKMYKIRKMEIKDYNEIINLWKNTKGVGLSGNDDSKK